MKRLLGMWLLAVVAAALVAACATLQDRWDEARSADTLAAYEEFLKEHPEGDLADQARARQSELIEERDWQETEANPGAAAYEAFLRNHPQGKYAGDARERLAALTPPPAVDVLPAGSGRFQERPPREFLLDETLSAEEKRAFELAVTGNTMAAYEAYLKQYPQGVFADDARVRIERFSGERARARGTLPADEARPGRQPQGGSADEARARQARLKAPPPAAGWGTLMYPVRKANIRAKRSPSSKLKGQLNADQPVKADFLQNGWYAVFPVTQKQRNEKLALGYVYAPLLAERRPPPPSVPAAPERKPAVESPPPKPSAPPRKEESDSLTVDVRDIIFKVAGDGKEWLFIEFSRYSPPAISSVEGPEPRIVLQIKDASAIRGEWTAIHTEGHLIRQISSSLDPRTRVLLIVLEMAPEKDYFVSQRFYRHENLYALEISENKGTRPP